MIPVRVLLVDDHLMLTEALAARLSAVPDLWVVGRCDPDDPKLAETARRLRPDVVTVEVEAVGVAAGTLLERLATAVPAAQLVVLTAGHDVGHAVQAARAGAAAWVSKECGVEELVGVLRGVRQGHAWYPPQVLGVVLRELRDDARRARDRSGPLDALSNRERDVLRLMVAGRGPREIAEALLISADTVRTHTRNVFGKLGVHSRLAAVTLARSAGLRPPDPADGGVDGSVDGLDGSAHGAVDRVGAAVLSFDRDRPS
ncbi:MAG TPA: response regulator transcription factor [Pseudonocardiaceae bacterium]|nr:response regulator transcription factor [Pseudonocardiaceae bacterium]